MAGLLGSELVPMELGQRAVG